LPKCSARSFAICCGYAGAADLDLRNATPHSTGPARLRQHARLKFPDIADIGNSAKIRKGPTAMLIGHPFDCTDSAERAMGQLGFFGTDRRLAALSEKRDPLEGIAALVPWESFRAEIEAVVLTPEAKKSRARRIPKKCWRIQSI
jgi:hypothetical protein